MKLTEVFPLHQLSDEEGEDLMLLMHDKELTGGGYSTRLPALEKALRFFSESCPKVLYRGLPPGRGNGTIVNGAMTFRGYASFSERRDIALRFAQETNVLVELTGQHRGFCFYKWIEREYRAMDPEAFESADGEATIELAREEAEWILPFKSSFEVVDERREANLRVITVR